MASAQLLGFLFHYIPGPPIFPVEHLLKVYSHDDSAAKGLVTKAPNSPGLSREAPTSGGKY